jgi:hypothetical protein
MILIFFNNLIIITRISLELKKIKKHQRLHSKFIECDISSLCKSWNCFKHFSINISNFEEFKQVLSLEIKTSSFRNLIIFVPSIPNSTLTQDVWKIYVETSFKPLFSQKIYYKLSIFKDENISIRKIIH